MAPEQREIYEERAAIMEYDGGLSREEAERRALRIAEGRGHELEQIEMDLEFQQFRRDWRNVLGAI